jgi:hypothetical protein
MVYPHIGHYRSKVGMLYVPAIAGAYLPCPLDAHGSPVWITGRTCSAMAIITSVSPDGRTVTVTGPSGWHATVDHRQVQFLGPTPYRDWVVAQTRHLTFVKHPVHSYWEVAP